MVGQTPQRFSGRCLTHARRGAHAGSDTSAFFGGMSDSRQTRRERGTTASSEIDVKSANCMLGI